MSVEKSKKTPDKRRKYDDAFKAEALRLASESRSTQAAAQQLGISPSCSTAGNRPNSWPK
jgi:transposase